MLNQESNELKKDFPIFLKEDFTYLDTSATSQKPSIVIDSINEYYRNFNANAGRGSYELSIMSKSIIENTRTKVKEFVGASENAEVIFTKNTTEAINIIAYCYGLNFINEKDEILIAVSNHHANIVPWQFVSKKVKARLKYIYLDKDGQLDIEDFKYKLNENTKLVCLSSAVNATGVLQDFEKIINLSHKKNAKVLLDCSQTMAHFKHEFDKWDVDFAVFSGHKMFSAFGVGVLYAKNELLDMMPPFLYGGDMIEYVHEQSTTYAKVPQKFEGGTLDTPAILSLSKAIDYINSISYERINKIEHNLMIELTFRLMQLDFVELYFTNVERVPVISFNVKGVHSHDTSFILDRYKVFVRSGQHCCAPLLNYMGINSTCRISISIYNTSKDIDRLIEALYKVKETMKI